MEVVPKNVARVGADRSEQPQIGIPSLLLMLCNTGNAYNVISYCW